MVNHITHPLVQHKLSSLRIKTTKPKEFRQLVNEIAMLLTYEVTRNLPMTEVEIETPLMSMNAPWLACLKPALISILRAGNGLLEGVLQVIPDAKVGHIGLYRDEQTYEPVEYLFKLPRVKNKKVLILDPMLATGNSSIAAINLIKNKGVNIKDIFLVSLLAAPEGIKNIQKNQKGIHIFTCNIDAKLNKNKFIVPGLGDAGDRYMGT